MGEDNGSANPMLDDDEQALPVVTGELPVLPGGHLSSGDPCAPRLPELEHELPAVALPREPKISRAEPLDKDPEPPEEPATSSVPVIDGAAAEAQADIIGDYSSPADTFGDDPEAALLQMLGMAGDEAEEDDAPPMEDSRDAYHAYFEDEEEEDILAGFDLDEILGDAIDMGASDVHISSGMEVCFTILGEVSRQPHYGVPQPAITQRVVQDILSNVLETSFIEELELDTSYVIGRGPHKGRRLRLSVGKSFGNIFFVFRVIADEIPSPEELEIDARLLEWTQLPSGLLMVNGTTGSGKSTTIASMLRRIQLTRPQKIITLERPIEFIFGDTGKAFVTQREIGKDARSFAAALTSAMRQAPDIILVGEVRNRLEIDSLLRSAETGHLSVSTMHTNSAANTINRIKSLYEGDDQKRVMATLADVSRGFVNQVLVKTADGKARFAVREILEVDEYVADSILEGNVKAIREYQVEQGLTMEHALVSAVKAGRCTPESARAASAYPRLFDRLMKD